MKVTLDNMNDQSDQDHKFSRTFNKAWWAVLNTFPTELPFDESL